MAVMQLGIPITEQHCIAHGVFGSVAGEAQTQNAAAIEALIYCAQNFAGSYVVSPDSSFLCGGWAELEAKCRDESLADRWAMLQSDIKKHPGTIQLCKVDAHMTLDAVAQYNVSYMDWAGNLYADMLAARGAELGEVTKNEAA